MVEEGWPDPKSRVTPVLPGAALAYVIAPAKLLIASPFHQRPSLEATLDSRPPSELEERAVKTGHIFKGIENNLPMKRKERRERRTCEPAPRFGQRALAEIESVFARVILIMNQ